MENETDVNSWLIQTILFEEINKAPSQSLKKKLLFVKKLQKDREIIEKDYKKEIVQLQYNYDEKYQKIYDEVWGNLIKASKIIQGELTELGHLVSSADIEKYKLNPQTSSTPLESGIPSFWNIALQKSKYFFVNKKDEEILKFLKDIRIEQKEDKVSFSVTFTFNANDYFNNTQITKTYIFSDEQELNKVESTLINWNSDEKNPMKELKKKQKKSININNN